MTLELKHKRVIFSEENEKEYNENKKIYDALNCIVDEALFDYTVNALNKYSSKNKILQATRVVDMVMFLLKDRKLVQDGIHQSFVDHLVMAAMLHNIIDVQEKNWNSVYAIRDCLSEVCIYNDMKLPYQILDAVCDIIEGQLGQHTPIKGSRPNPNTPGELFATAVALDRNFYITKK